MALQYGYSGYQPLPYGYGAEADLTGAAPGRPAALPPLAPEEESSLLAKLGAGALHGVGYVGSILDKFGGTRAIRGLLGGKPRELLSLLPGSDVLGITNPEENVTSRDLLTNWGITEAPTDDESFLSPANLGSMALDVLLSPATYLSFGGSAVAKGLGGVAQKAGIPLSRAEKLAGLTGAETMLVKGQPVSKLERLARAATGTEELMGPLPSKALQDVANVRLGGDVGFGIPFMGNNLGTASLSEVANAIPGLVPAAKGVATVAGAIPGAPALGAAAGAVGGKLGELGRSAAALFQKSRGGQIEPGAIEAAQEAAAALPGVQAAKREELIGLREAAARAGTLEAGALPSAEQIARARMIQEGNFIGPLSPAEQELFGGYQGIAAKGLTEKARVGLEPNVLESGVGEPLYATRFRTLEEAGRKTGGGAQALTPAGEAEIGRAHV